MRIALNQDRSFTEILVADGLISPQRLAQALGERDDTTEPIGDLLVRLGLITERDKVICLGKQNGILYADLPHRELEPTVTQRISHSLALRLQVIPIAVTAKMLSLAMTLQRLRRLECHRAEAALERGRSSLCVA